MQITKEFLSRLQGYDVQIVDRRMDLVFKGAVKSASFDGEHFTIEFLDLGVALYSAKGFVQMSENEGGEIWDREREAAGCVYLFWVLKEPLPMTLLVIGGNYVLVWSDADEHGVPEYFLVLNPGRINKDIVTILFSPPSWRTNRKFFRSQAWIDKVRNMFPSDEPIRWREDGVCSVSEELLPE